MIQRLPKGTRYYFVNTRMETTSNTDYGDEDATKRFEAGNYFEDEIKCEKYSNFFREFLKTKILSDDFMNNFNPFK